MFLFKLIILILSIFFIIIMLYLALILIADFCFNFDIESWMNKKLTSFILELKIKKEIKNKKLLSYEALKFEYSEIANIVDEEIKKLKKDYMVVSGMYLVRLHEYYQDILKIRYVKRNSIEFFSCVYKAFINETILVNLKGNDCKISNVDLELKERVIERLSQNYTDIYYNNEQVNKTNKRKFIGLSLNEHEKYDDYTFWISFELLREVV